VIDRFRAGAALTLFTIIISVWLYWPLPDLGFEADPVTGIVVGVAPNLAAAQGGLLPGDQVISIYGYPLSAVNTRVLLVPLPWREGMTSPLQVQRNGTGIDLTLRPGRPSLALQVDKALRGLVALTCWATGMLIASSPQASNRRYQWAAWFWMILGAALGLLLLVQIVSELLTVAVLWLLCTILAPAAVVMHIWYPGRPIPAAIERRTRRWWLGSMLVLQVLFLGLAISGRTTYGLHKLLDSATTLAFLMSFVLSAVILWQAYQATTISHIRRQIRLIVWACAIVACVWFILVFGAIVTPQLMRLVPSVTLTVVAVIVPLAYLVGSMSGDLLRVDLLARRLVLEASTLLAITALLAAATRTGFFTPTPTLLAVVVIALYRPTQSLIRRALSSDWTTSGPTNCSARRRPASARRLWPPDSRRSSATACARPSTIRRWRCISSANRVARCLSVSHHIGSARPQLPRRSSSNMSLVVRTCSCRAVRSSSAPNSCSWRATANSSCSRRRSVSGV
jgi:hypothetical protein